MKTIKTLFFTLLTLFFVQSVNAQCSAAFYIAGNGPTYNFTPSNTPTAPLGYYSFDWDFGDGSPVQSTANMNSIPHTYATNGTYTVTCIVYDSIFCSDTVSMNLTIIGAGGPVCDASFAWYDSNGVIYFMPLFPDTSLAYAWAFGDGTTSSAMNPTHQYNPTGIGPYQVCLTISNATCTDTYCDSVLIQNGPGLCDASFTYSDSAGYLTFMPLFSNATTTYSWTASNGMTSTLENPTFQFAQGNHTVCLVITDPANSCSDSVCTTVFVVLPAPIISGFVIMGTNPADSGVVFLIEYDSVAGTLTAIDTTNIDSMGTYLFTNVGAGDYLVKAALSPNSTGYSNYLPTYYSIGVQGQPNGVLLWGNADYASSPNNSYYPINLVAGTNAGGPGFVGGLVSQGANKVGDPISDILVIVTDMSGNPLAYEYSDNTGNFTIGNLPYGDYVLYPEVYGKTTTPMNFTLSASNPNMDNFKIEVNSQTVVVSTVTGIKTVEEFSNVRLYPNPVQDVLTIDFGKTISDAVAVALFDVAGRRISIQNVTATNMVRVNTNQLDGGVYLIKLSGTEGEQVFRFVK